MGIGQDVLAQIVAGNIHLDDLAAALGRPKGAVVNAVQQLKKRGLIIIDTPGAYVATQAGLDWVNSGAVISSGKNGTRLHRHSRGLRQRAWWVIRRQRTVSLPDLLSTLAEGSEKDAAGNLSRYLRLLARAGFLQALEKRTPGHGATSNGYLRYRLARDNGRQAPVVRLSRGEVYDPNTDEAFPLAPIEANDTGGGASVPGGGLE